MAMRICNGFRFDHKWNLLRIFITKLQNVAHVRTYTVIKYAQP